MDILSILKKEFNLSKSQVENTVELLDEGGTIPFIARYRKEQTGGLEDVVIRDLANRLDYLRNLETRKEEVLRLIRESLKLEDSEELPDKLEEKINKAESMQKLDDLYRPYRPKRRTRATIAREKGLEGLKELIVGQEISEEELFKEIHSRYIDPEKDVNTREDAIKGALDIFAEDFSDHPSIREKVRTLFLKEGLIETEAIDLEVKSQYEMYYNYREPIKQLANHRVLAINRGEKDKVLRVGLSLDKLDIVELLSTRIIKDKGSSLAKYIEAGVEDAYKRLLFPSIEREIRSQLTERAEEEAIKVFALNLEPLLLQPPLKGKKVLAVDPGFRTGCKIAALDEIGNLKDYATIYPTEPRNDIEGSKEKLKKFIREYEIDIIAIGNGTASRETELVVADTIRELDTDCSYIIISEAGASVYSASDVAREEFPDLDVSIRGAISIGRRLQDPLAELVKIDPKHIGVGQYQHDLNQKKLSEALRGVVEDSVNRVGVDLNTASASLLSYVAGLSKRVSKNILEHRKEIGLFTNRKELLDVKGLGPKTFTQCAGFLRIAEGENPLDNTAVHPESYKVAQELINYNYKDENIEKLAEKLEVGIPTLKDIIDELEKPGRDPRDEMPKPILRQDILKLEDLKEDMIVKGTIRNVVDFGVFVDIGVGQDGLVHISKLSDKFVRHPKELYQVGDIIEARILEIDGEKGRIGLSIRDL